MATVNVRYVSQSNSRIFFINNLNELTELDYRLGFYDNVIKMLKYTVFTANK